MTPEMWIAGGAVAVALGLAAFGGTWHLGRTLGGLQKSTEAGLENVYHQLTSMQRDRDADRQDILANARAIAFMEGKAEGKAEARGAKT